MATLLHLDASPRTTRSHSRRLTARFAEHWRTANPDGVVLYRDLRVFTPPHVSEDWIAAAFTPEGQRTSTMRNALAISDMLVDEVLAADELLLGIPMYNWSMPSVVKAWIDNIVRINRTWAFTPDHPEGNYKPLVHGKRVFVVVTSGDNGLEPGGENWHVNHLEPHLRTILGMLGMKELHFIYSGNDEHGGERLERSLANAERLIDEIGRSRRETTLVQEAAS